jgi:endoglucanase
MTQSDDINTSIEKATKSFILNRADRMLSMVKSNAYNLTNRIPDIPILNGYYSAGNNIELCRAHYLSNEKKYLEGALLSVMYTAGANPMNMTMTTGLGHRSPNRPLHLDSQYSGQKAPEGITVYAQADHLYFKNQTEEENLGKSWATWAIYWIGQQARIPGPWEWPPHEGYIDYSKFPSMNEYTIHQTFGPISYAYGYLASRPN